MTSSCLNSSVCIIHSSRFSEQWADTFAPAWPSKTAKYDQSLRPPSKPKNEKKD